MVKGNLDRELKKRERQLEVMSKNNIALQKQVDDLKAQLTEKEKEVQAEKDKEMESDIG